MPHRMKGKEIKLFLSKSVKLAGKWTSHFRVYTSAFLKNIVCQHIIILTLCTLKYCKITHM